jgi:hypothetical protein
MRNVADRLIGLLETKRASGLFLRVVSLDLSVDRDVDIAIGDNPKLEG